MQESNISTTLGSAKLIESSKGANLLFSKRIQFYINNALNSAKSQINILNFKDIYRNRYHIKTINKENIEYLYIMNMISSKGCMLENLLMFFSCLYYTYIST